jgi:hypothetical protein
MRQSTDIVTRSVMGETVLLPLRPGKDGLWLYELNETGQFLWSLLASEKSGEELIHSLCEEYELTTEQASEDLAAFLSDLKSIGAVQ